MKYFDYIINGKFESFTHPKEGLTPLDGITPEIRRFPKVEGGKVVLDTDALQAYELIQLNEAKEKQKQLINSKCKKQIESGFIWNDYTFDSKIHDQFWIKASSDLSGERKLRAFKAGVKDRYTFTQTERKQIVSSFASHIDSLLDIANTKKTQIDSCQTTEEVESITWE